ncbi:hypothetical protein [Roseateles sp. YR242]|uniref:hypothetical protein n=1 Tax=Roseateles sp. YR242 TaxID=1855305 RepID=UPI0011602ACC|nr:hypothetical protein [Roseateles sp. YR242]
MSERLAALGLHLPSAPGAHSLIKDARQMRELYRFSRMRKLHAAIPEAEWRDYAEPRAPEVLNVAREGRDLKHFVVLQQSQPFKQYLSLLEAEHLLEATGGSEPEVHERIAAAQAAIWDSHAADIALDFHTSAPLLSITRSLHGWDEARAIYRDWVPQSNGMQSLYRNLHQAFGPARLRAGLVAMRNALRADLASPLVLRDRTRWQTQTIDLERTAVLERLVASADQFMDKGVPDVGQERWGQFMSEVIECTAGQVSERRLQTLHAAAFPDRSYSPNDRGAVVNFLLKALPMDMWEQPEVRDALRRNPVTLQVK